MELDKIRIEPRLRNQWQAIDLGCELARHWYLPMFLAWLIPALLLWLPLSLWSWDNQWWVIALIWWCKPMFERLPLYYASRALFGEKLGLIQLLRAFWRANKFQWLPWLTLRRLSPTRSLDMPVTLLEQLKGAARARRLRVMHQNTGGGSWLTLVGVHVEMFISFGVMGLIMWLIPSEVNLGLMDDFIAQPPWFVFVGNVVSLLAMALVAPFYVASGFSLYINRRVRLEGWDIEIRLRQLLEREQARRARLKTVGATLTLLLALVLPLATPAPVQAQTERVEPLALERDLDSARQTSRDFIDEVLERADFHAEKTVTRIRPKQADDQADSPSDQSEFPEWLIRIIEWFESWGEDDADDAEEESQEEESPSSPSSLSWLFQLLEVLLWIAAISGVGYLIYHYRHHLGDWAARLGPSASAKPEAAEVLFGLDLREQSLPSDVPGEVRALWQRAKVREALSLLYRASLSKLINRHGFVFYDGHTERECAAIVAARAEVQLAAYVDELTAVWTRLAYAHREPSEAQVDELCQRWGVLDGGADEA